MSSDAKKICVQTGRVVFVNQKKYANKLGVIVNVIDQNRALCDIFSPHGPKLRFLNRASVQFKVMRLTKFMVKGVFHNSYSKFVTDKVREQTILSQFQKTKFYQNWQKRFKRENMTDYERFKCAYVNKLREAIIMKKMKIMRKTLPRPPMKAKKLKTASKRKTKLAQHRAARAKAGAGKKKAAAATPASKA